MLEHCDAVRKQQSLATLVLDRNPFIGSVEVLLLSDREVQRSGVVDRVPHLVDVPVGSKEGCIAYSHVIPEALDLLGVPQREGVVVTVGYQ